MIKWQSEAACRSPKLSLSFLCVCASARVRLCVRKVTLAVLPTCLAKSIFSSAVCLLSGSASQALPHVPQPSARPQRAAGLAEVTFSIHDWVSSRKDRRSFPVQRDKQPGLKNAVQFCSDCSFATFPQLLHKALRVFFTFQT